MPEDWTLTNSASSARDHLRLEPLTDLLAPSIRRDGSEVVFPFMLAREGKNPRVFARHQEKGNLAAIGVALDQVDFYEPYFNFNDGVSLLSMPLNIGQAVKQAVGDAEVRMPGETPTASFESLVEGGVQVSFGQEVDSLPPVRSLEMPVEVVRERWESLRNRSRTQGRFDVNFGGGFDSEGHDIDRFRLLGDGMRMVGAGAVLVMSPVNFECLTGLPWTEGAFAVWVLDSTTVTVGGDESRWSGLLGGAETQHDDIIAAVRNAAPGAVVGIEEAWCSIGFTSIFHQRRMDIARMSRHFSYWREDCDLWESEAYWALAKISARAIERSLEWLLRESTAGTIVTEHAIARRYRIEANLEAESMGLRGHLMPLFTNLHWSHRTIFPSIPTCEPVYLKKGGSLKLDAGLRLVVDGVTVATSDVARTATLSPHIQEGYDIARSAVLESIRSLEVGQALGDGHAGVMMHLEASRPQLEQLGLQTLDPSTFHQLYGYRNLGHLMGKQESFVSEFRPGCTRPLRVGAVGACEIQWPVDDVILGYEDMWLCAPSGEIYNITAQVENMPQKAGSAK